MTQLALAFDAASFARAAREPRSYFVRSHQTVPEVEAGEAQAGMQEQAILGWFQAQPAGERFTPSFVGAAFMCWPLTSVRARITTLTRKGLLTHWPGDRRPGPLGRPESVWSLSEAGR